MKATNALVAAAFAGVFAAGTAVANTAPQNDFTVVAGKDKDDCPGKDGCPGKDKEKKKEEGTIVAGKDKDDCPGKDGCSGKKKEKEEGTIL